MNLFSMHLRKLNLGTVSLVFFLSYNQIVEYYMFHSNTVSTTPSFLFVLFAHYIFFSDVCILSSITLRKLKFIKSSKI